MFKRICRCKFPNRHKKSTSGIVVLLGKVLIGWKSIRQKHLSLSTMEAEFSCLSLLCTELVCYNQLMLDMGIKVHEPIVVYEDNQAAIQWLRILQLRQEQSILILDI
uniref:Reverse transcriptase Ty1/copia-type domain-containing protein n=1 Tax=Micrurus carvalhoi TaxID=3147026 RepID=A0A2H6NC77_9SAUR